MIEFNGRQYLTEDSARVMKWKLQNRDKWRASRTRANKKFPGKRSARRAVWDKIMAGKMLPAKKLPCFECAEPARVYHHYKGYRRENRFCVVALCNVCNSETLRKENR